MPSIAEFKANFLGGARPTLYNVLCSFPAGISDLEASKKLQFAAKGAQLPGISLSPIEVPYQGRTIKLAGDRQFQPITLTVVNDSDWVVRNAFERWMNFMNQHGENRGASRPSEYQVDMILEQLDRDGSVIATYTLIGAFPSDVSPIDMGFDMVDTVEEFSVTLEYSYYVRPDVGII